MRYPIRWLSPDEPGGGGVAAPAAPAAPAAAPIPDLAPPITPLQQAIATARANIANAATAAAAAPPAPAAAPADDRPRNPDGTFKAEAPPEGTPPTEAPAGDQPPVEGEAPPSTEDNPLRVEVPGRRPEDPPDVYEAATPEQADRLRQLVNGYNRTEALKQQEFRIRADRQQLDEVAARLQFDPEGFLFENIPQERAASVALQVLLQPEVWSQVNDVLLELMESDDKRELVRVSMENSRLKNRDDAQAAVARQRESSQNASVIKQTIAMMIPDTLPEAEQLALYTACQQDVVAHAERLRLDTMDPRDVPLVIAQRLRAGGVDPVQAASKLTRQAAGQPRGGPVRGVAPQERPPAPAPSGKALAAAHAAARAASVAAPAGAGAPSAAGTGAPPANQTIEERIRWGRNNLKFTSGH